MFVIEVNGEHVMINNMRHNNASTWRQSAGFHHGMFEYQSVIYH